jgi:hypothetical protein
MLREAAVPRRRVARDRPIERQSSGKAQCAWCHAGLHTLHGPPRCLENETICAPSDLTVRVPLYAPREAPLALARYAAPNADVVLVVVRITGQACAARQEILELAEGCSADSKGKALG